ncbi:MAG: MOSC N-terminal beta barrel domain-containing protein [Oculatellaceae cyanobacterium Prado106]|jgi:hypothetical protein|nr:MOSC N-terminal beta barrel domain-containing protein [Oculatellaceae cyanobacterium Prado106]
MPYLSKILLYPIKSLDGVEVSAATILPGGALAQDREFAIVDAQGKWVNAKRTDQIHRLRSHYNLPDRTVTLKIDDQEATETFHLDESRSPLESYLSDFFGFPVQLQQNLHMGFPDDVNASGPTLVSVESLQTVATWFNLSAEEVRRRFRANLEISDAPTFWEDQLLAEAGQLLPFSLGQVQFLGSHTCSRCVVPTRDSWTGDRNSQFQKQFITRRQSEIPEGVKRDRFDHYYRFTLNTQVPATEAGKQLHLLDPIMM